MPEGLPITPIRNFLNGVIRPAEVGAILKPEGAVDECINGHFDSKGRVSRRYGYTRLGTAAVSSGYPILGLHNFRDAPTGTNHRLLAVAADGTNSDVYYLNSSNVWTKTLQDDTKDLKTRFATFLDRIIRVNGTDAAKSWDGDTANAWLTTGGPLDIADAPIGSFVEVYKSRLYIATASTLYFTPVPTSSMTIAWNISDDYTLINPNDGDDITALKRFALELCVFKRDYTYRWRGIAGTDPDPLIGVGTHSQESVVSSKAGISFHHPTGLYLYRGSTPGEISRPISDFVDNVSSSEYANVSSWQDGDHIYWSVGDVTIAGVTVTNVIFRYTISSQVWTVYSTAHRIRVGAQYISGTTATQVVGDATGSVHTFNSGNSDNGTAISYRLMTKYYELGAIASASFTVNHLTTLCEKAQGMTLSYRVDDDPRWKPIGQLQSYVTHFKSDKVNATGHRIQFLLSGISSAEPWIFEGIEILRGIREGVVE